MSAAVLEHAAEEVPAALEPRLNAFAIDRAIGWGLPLLLGWLLVASDQSWTTVLASVLGLALVLLLGTAALLGARGTSPGLVATGLRLVAADTGRPPGFAAAVRRQAILALAGLPTFGLGLATLSWTVATDPEGRRRGWHDVVSGTVVVDVRPVAVVEAPRERPQPIVNLTAMRLAAGEPVVPPTPVVPRPAAVPPPVLQAPQAPAPAREWRPGRRRADVPPGQVEAAPAAAPPAPVAAGTGWRLRFDTGEDVEVRGLVLIGRGPQARPGEAVAHLVPLRSGDMSVSKTHAQVQPAEDGSLVAMDRGSTNGSVVVRRGVPRHLSPGRPMTLLEGDVVRFGDRAMEVLRGS